MFGRLARAASVALLRRMISGSERLAFFASKELREIEISASVEVAWNPCVVVRRL